MVLSGEKYFEKRSPDGFYPERSILKRGVLMVLSGKRPGETWQKMYWRNENG